MTMSKDENDLWSDVNNPNNEKDLDDWADVRISVIPNSDSGVIRSPVSHSFS